MRTSEGVILNKKCAGFGFFYEAEGVKMDVGGIIEEAHDEEGVRVIDKFKVEHISLVLEDDYIVRMPPIREYTIRAKIKSIEKGTPRFVEDEMKNSWLWAKVWKRAAKKWRRYTLLLKRDNDSQRAIASQVPYLKERIKKLERQIPARTFDIEDY